MSDHTRSHVRQSASQDDTHTDISHLVDRARDAFDISSWGSPESEPRPVPKEQADHIEMHEAAEHEPAPEVAGYVEEVQQPVNISDDVQDLGVETIEKPIQYPQQNTVKVPLSDDKILQGKKMPLDSSFRWLAEVCLYILRKAHIRLRVAHGKAVRIFEKAA